MNNRHNRAFLLTGFLAALAIAVFLSPFASKHPDGLVRVSEDLQFHRKEAPEPPAGKLPPARIFDGYALKGVPEYLATPLAGLVGTLATFGLAWGIGKLTVPKSDNPRESSGDR
ncbi:PDGLE domain-containing protein [Pannus brasiliensis CCIBt3594]|uniref:PDGLE domain-containing protein n=1 Tax=Pannus brasiliensis CCIBt3594 TaxID=1427578 RepID=A0AAW9QKD5_9CHRO